MNSTAEHGGSHRPAGLDSLTEVFDCFRGGPMLVGLLAACALVLGAAGVSAVASPDPAARAARAARFPGERLLAARPTIHLLELAAVTAARVSQRISDVRVRVVR